MKNSSFHLLALCIYKYRVNSRNKLHLATLLGNSFLRVSPNPSVRPPVPPFLRSNAMMMSTEAGGETVGSAAVLLFHFLDDYCA